MCQKHIVIKQLITKQSITKHIVIKQLITKQSITKWKSRWFFWCFCENVDDKGGVWVVVEVG